MANRQNTHQNVILVSDSPVKSEVPAIIIIDDEDDVIALNLEESFTEDEIELLPPPRAQPAPAKPLEQEKKMAVAPTERKPPEASAAKYKLPKSKQRKIIQEAKENVPDTQAIKATQFRRTLQTASAGSASSSSSVNTDELVDKGLDFGLAILRSQRHVENKPKQQKPAQPQITKAAKERLQKRKSFELHKQRLLQKILTIDPNATPGPPETLPTVPVTFKSFDEYFQVFEQHLTEECTAIIRKGLEERDDYERDNCTLNNAQHNQNNFCSIQLRTNSSIMYNHADIVLMEAFVDGKTVACLGYVNSRDMFLSVLLNLGGREAVWSNSMTTTGQKWTVRRISSISSLLKAFRSSFFMELATPCIRQALLDPFCHKSATFKKEAAKEKEKIKQMSKRYEIFLDKNFNNSQKEAIKQGYDNVGFLLIQGPPGTGKTRTIIGMIGSILQFNRISKTQGSSNNRHVLVCAPSNSSLDEILSRLKRLGLYHSTDSVFKPKMVRIGVKDKLNDDISEYYIDNLVDNEIKKQQGQIRSSLESTEDNYKYVFADLENKLRSSPADLKEGIQKEIRQAQAELQQSKANANKELMKLEDRQTRYKLKKEIINDADIVFSTLGSLSMDDFPSFNTIIIDECCQSVEPENIIPIGISVNCKSVILVGDPQQLPATVLSQTASKFNYKQSLMERLLKGEFPKVMLNVQFRMHPTIRAFPSAYFYNQRLVDSDDVAQHGTWLYEAGDFPPYRFYDITYGKERSSSSFSVMNLEEAEFSTFLCLKLLNAFSNSPERLQQLEGKIGIISPYRKQILEIKKQLSDHCKGNSDFERIVNSIDISTVDGYQGKEKEIIIFSCVRAASGKDSIGFLNDVRRLNVAITRARACLWIVGHAGQLMKNYTWKKLIEDAQTRNCFVAVKAQPKLNDAAPKTVMNRPDISASSSSVKPKAKESAPPGSGWDMKPIPVSQVLGIKRSREPPKKQTKLIEMPTSSSSRIPPAKKQKTEDVSGYMAQLTSQVHQIISTTAPQVPVPSPPASYPSIPASYEYPPPPLQVPAHQLPMHSAHMTHPSFFHQPHLLHPSSHMAPPADPTPQILNLIPTISHFIQQVQAGNEVAEHDVTNSQPSSSKSDPVNYTQALKNLKNIKK